MMLYFYCFISVYFSLERQFVCFVQFCLLYLLDPSILVWERDTLHLFHLEYSCASLIPVEYSCLAAFLLSALSFYMYLVQSSQFSFEESTLLLHLYLFGECSNKFIGVWLDQKMCYACGSGIKCLHESLQIIVLSNLILVNSFELSSMSCLSLFIM